MTATRRTTSTPSPIRMAGVALALGIACFSAACGDDAASSSSSGSDQGRSSSATATAPDAGATDPTAFCAIFAQLDREYPESYYGSAEHLDALERLRAAAPAEITGLLDTYAAFVASGAISPGVVGAADIETFPADVQQAVTRLSEYTNATCDDHLAEDRPPTTS